MSRNSQTIDLTNPSSFPESLHEMSDSDLYDLVKSRLEESLNKMNDVFNPIHDIADLVCAECDRRGKPSLIDRALMEL